MAGRYDYLKSVTPNNEYTNFRGVADFSNLKQFNLFETGHSGITVISMPQFMLDYATSKLDDAGAVANMNEAIKLMIEHEFKGLTGLPDMQGETQTITDGISELNMITKNNWDSSVTISMTFYEKSGSLIEKWMEFYLTGIKDPRTQAKHYNGLIDQGYQASYDKEVFQLLYWVTDNTYTALEKAFLLCNWQPTTARMSQFDSTKGTIEFVEVTLEGACYPIIGPEVDKRALKILKYMRKTKNTDKKLNVNSNDFTFSAIKDGNTFDSYTKQFYAEGPDVSYYTNDTIIHSNRDNIFKESES